jgi:NodT family efflux transporter outer membrane factor (OMF) lipoprotein
MSRARTLPIAAALALSGAMLSGCLLGPDYKPPVPPTGATAPLVSVDPSLETAAEPPDAWWRLYEDPLLDRLVAQAFAANRDIAAAEANLSAARAALEGARNGLYPQTNLNFGAKYGRDAITDEILEINGHKPETIWVFDDIIDVSYELDLFGRVRRSIEASRDDAEASAASRDAVRITVAAETTRAYVQICALGEELAVARRSVEVTGQEAEIARQRLRLGAGSDFDVVRAEQVQAQASAAIPPLEGQRRAALFQLTALLGRTPSQAVSEAEGCIAPPRLQAPLPVGDGGSLLKRRPDVRLADRRLAAATARIGVATAELYPRITLTGLYGGASPAIQELTSNSGLTWGVGPEINWTFPNMAGPRARLKAAKANEAASLATFDATVLQALKEAEQSLAVYGAELDHRRALGEAQDKAARAFDMAHGQFAAGSASTLDTLTSEQALVAANAQVAASDAALAQDQIAVFKALGGGWR